jgi:hypothetical protein
MPSSFALLLQTAFGGVSTMFKYNVKFSSVEVPVCLIIVCSVPVGVDWAPASSEVGRGGGEAAAVWLHFYAFC